MSDRPTAGSSSIKPESRYTVQDYLSWSSDRRWELIHGVPYYMSPAPSVPHQRIVGGVYSALRVHAQEQTPCETFIAPTDLFLPSATDGEDNTVVQPDVMVVCDPAAEGVYLAMP